MAEALDRRHIAEAFAHPAGSAALAAAMAGTYRASEAAKAGVPWEELRARAHAIKAYAIANLDRLLEQFEAEFVKRGGTVLWAPTAADANSLVIDICRRHGARSLVKGKSMVSEEIGLNEHLRDAGIEAVETDLGEFIIQLAGQKPSHIVGPALHLSRADIGQLFARKLDIDYTDDPVKLMDEARRRLRTRYLESTVGVTGVNFAIAETGAVVVVENEGNGGLCASVPPVHIMLMGIEKVIPRSSDLPVFLQLLARAATGQKLTAYTHCFAGAPATKTAYCIIIDAGRCALLADPKTRQSLYCIRCGACLNVCPVYRRAGGWAYGGTYSGPIGAVVTPVQAGFSKAAELPFASSLCSACQDACPVAIDLAHQLVYLRQRAVKEGAANRRYRRAISLWARTMCSLTSYRRAVRWLRRAERFGRIVDWYPGMLGTWAKMRSLPPIAPQSFKEWWVSR